MILSRRQISTCMIMLVACVSMAQASCTKKKTALGRRQKFGPEDFVTDSFLQIPDNIGGGTFRRLVTIEEFPVLEGFLAIYEQKCIVNIKFFSFRKRNC